MLVLMLVLPRPSRLKRVRVRVSGAAGTGVHHRGRSDACDNAVVVFVVAAIVGVGVGTYARVGICVRALAGGAARATDSTAITVRAVDAPVDEGVPAVARKGADEAHLLVDGIRVPNGARRAHGKRAVVRSEHGASQAVRHELAVIVIVVVVAGAGMGARARRGGSSGGGGGARRHRWVTVVIAVAVGAAIAGQHQP
jgi:hypothetical protein